VNSPTNVRFLAEVVFTMNIRFFAIAALVSGVAVFGQTVPTPPAVNPYAAALASDAAFQVRFASNLSIGDSVVNFSNSGASSTNANTTNAPFAQNGEICANVYAYSPDEQLVSCCSCNVTPNALNSLSARNDLASNTLTPIVPSALVIKVLATPGGTACTASTAAIAGTAAAPLVPGLLAWGTTIHALPTAGAYGVVETAFATPQLSEAERTRMTQLCAFIRANGSGYGICKSCKVGGLGAATK
jgi:hypothetical protein